MFASSRPSSRSPITARSRPPHGRCTPCSPTCRGHIARLEESSASPSSTGPRRAHRRGRAGRRARPTGAARDRRHLRRHGLARRRRVGRRPDRRDRHHRPLADAAAARRRRRAPPARAPDRRAKAARPRSCPGSCRGQLDAAIVHLPVDDPELIVEPLFAEDLILLVHASHPLADRDELSLRELADVPLLLPPKGTALRRVLDRAAGSVDVSAPRPGRDRRRPPARVAGVRRLRRGDRARHRGTQQLDGDFKRITVPELPRRVVGWVRRRRPGPSAATSAVAMMLGEVVHAHADEQPGVHLTTDTFPLHRST